MFQTKAPGSSFRTSKATGQYFHPRSHLPLETCLRRAGGTRVEIVHLPEDPEKVRLLIDTAPINTVKTLDGRA
ncbi:hypothetical protein Vqi01_57350 [Micromonospora qiuiae]|uniref:Uncharacterized protein n=2 Tax=Micromonospora qiuiae TaxID=502268 RepID=A0ABQ4JIZ0_9ACTN|nr:hypothetical protein Vqi01_57350 [Micromonospora qiuiae]